VRKLFSWVWILLFLWAVRTVQSSEKPADIIAEGTPAATPYFVQDSGVAGPIVLITGGVHGDEPAGAYAADQIRHWPITRGKLIVAPRANVVGLAAGKRNTPGEPVALANLNRNFPRAASNEPPRGLLATALWNFAREQKPTWFIDLHEGSDFNGMANKSVGSSLIVFPTTEGKAVAPAIQTAVNAAITNQSQHFSLLGPPIDGSFARAAGAHLGAHAMIFETTMKTQPLSLRARQHRIMVHTLLKHLDMIGESVTVDWITDQSVAGRASLRIALYDAGGTGSKGVQRVQEIMGKEKNTTVVEVGPDEIQNGALSQFNVVICPGGTGGGQARAIGEDGRVRIRKFVEDGAGYVGICAGAYLATSGFSWGLKILDAKTVSPKWERGRATVKIELTDKGRQILGDRRGLLDCKYHNGPILCPAKVESLPDYEVLAFFRTEVAEHNSPKGIMVNSPAAVAGRCGKGHVIVISPHPEQTDGLEDFIPRAVAWVTSRDEKNR